MATATPHPTNILEFRDLGPVPNLSLPIPEEGGVVVFRGPNGIGKTTLINATDALLAGERNGITARDGAATGEASGFGMTMKVGRTTRCLGELEVSHLGGKFDLADLIDPGIKDVKAADEKRIKTLVSLARAKADPALFHKLLGGADEFTAIVKPDLLENDDLVVMAGKVKKDIEAKARDAETEVEREKNAAAGCRAAVGSVDLEAPDDAAALQKDLEAAITKLSKLKADAESAARVKQAAELAQQGITAWEANQKGPGIAAATECVTQATEARDAAKARVDELCALIEAARKDLEAKKAALDLATQTLEAAKSQASAIETWRKQVEDAAAIVAPPQSLIETAAARVQAAREAVETGALVRQAKQQAAKADGHLRAASEHGRLAKRLRDAAAGVDIVLSEVVKGLGCPLEVWAGRLVTKHKRSEHTNFGDLSVGERMKIVLPLAIQLVGPKGIIPLRQEFFEGLDWEGRQQLMDELRGSGVVVITAECSRSQGEHETGLTAQVLE